MITWETEGLDKVGVTESLYLDDQYLGMLYRWHHGTEPNYLFVGNHESRRGLGALREYIEADSLEEAKEKALDLIVAFFKQKIGDLEQAATNLKNEVIKLEMGKSKKEKV